jgi:hypothetical protein
MANQVMADGDGVACCAPDTAEAEPVSVGRAAASDGACC